MSAQTYEPVALTGGQWVAVRGVLRWRADPRPLEAVPDLPPPPDLSALIACPTCRATVTETCRTKTGHRTAAHGDRLVPRLCPCGESLGWKRRYCDSCRDEHLQRSKREHNRRLRETA